MRGKNLGLRKPSATASGGRRWRRLPATTKNPYRLQQALCPNLSERTIDRLLGLSAEYCPQQERHAAIHSRIAGGGGLPHPLIFRLLPHPPLSPRSIAVNARTSLPLAEEQGCCLFFKKRPRRIVPGSTKKRSECFQNRHFSKGDLSCFSGRCVDGQTTPRDFYAHLYMYRGTPLIRNSRPLGPYSRTLPRVPGGSYGRGRFLVSEVPL